MRFVPSVKPGLLAAGVGMAVNTLLAIIERFASHVLQCYDAARKC
jgi:hypothetical protein